MLASGTLISTNEGYKYQTGRRICTFCYRQQRVRYCPDAPCDTKSIHSMTAISSLSAVSLANVPDQSVDCVKLLTLDGKIQYMNRNGLRAMEVEDFSYIKDAVWANLFPEPTRQLLIASYPEVASGQTVEFRAFCPTAKGGLRWWDISISPVADVLGVIVGFLAISRDVTFIHQSCEALKIAAAEMRHRLRNAYQITISLMLITARGNPALEIFAKQMADRLNALSRAQALFTESEEPCDFAKLISALITPFGNAAGQLSFDHLPAIVIQPPQADALTLVVGELAVNSAKHGAFANGGAVHVSASNANNFLTVTWRERCDLPVQKRSREGGQGLKLMDQIMRARDGSIVIEWKDHGMIATMAMRLTPSPVEPTSGDLRRVSAVIEDRKLEQACDVGFNQASR